MPENSAASVGGGRTRGAGRSKSSTRGTRRSSQPAHTRHHRAHDRLLARVEVVRVPPAPSAGAIGGTVWRRRSSPSPRRLALLSIAGHRLCRTILTARRSILWSAVSRSSTNQLPWRPRLRCAPGPAIRRGARVSPPRHVEGPRRRPATRLRAPGRVAGHRVGLVLQLCRDQAADHHRVVARNRSTGYRTCRRLRRSRRSRCWAASRRTRRMSPEFCSAGTGCRRSGRER